MSHIYFQNEIQNVGNIRVGMHFNKYITGNTNVSGNQIELIIFKRLYRK